MCMSKTRPSAKHRQTPFMSSFPPDAVAVSYRRHVPRSTLGFGQRRRSKLQFRRRSAPFIEPAIGIDSGNDALTQVELTFESR